METDRTLFVRGGKESRLTFAFTARGGRGMREGQHVRVHPWAFTARCCKGEVGEVNMAVLMCARVGLFS